MFFSTIKKCNDEQGDQNGSRRNNGIQKSWRRSYSVCLLFCERYSRDFFWV